MAGSSINLTNQFLIAMPGMGDGTFAGSVIYMCEHTEKGALGLVINKPSDIKVKQPVREGRTLELDRDELAEEPVYLRRPRADRARLRAAPADRWPRKAIRAAATAPRCPDRGRAGDDDQQGRAGGARRWHRSAARCSSRWATAGWGAGQLEEELEQATAGSTSSAEPGIIFDTPIEERYDKALLAARHRRRGC